MRRPWQVLVGVKRGGLWDNIGCYTFATLEAAERRAKEVLEEGAARPWGPEWGVWIRGPGYRQRRILPQPAPQQPPVVVGVDLGAKPCYTTSRDGGI